MKKYVLSLFFQNPNLKRKTMKKVLFFAASAACLTLTSFTGVTPNAPISFSSHQSYEDIASFQNDCTGEMMDYSGQVNTDIHGVVNGNKVSFIAHLNYQGLTAIGENGTVYHGSGVQNIAQSSSIKGKGTYTAITNIKFTAPGKKNNFIIRMVNHFTITTKGEVSSSHETADFGSCQ
jgi:hypothetical protein